MRLAIFGGTFNPIHVAHVAMGEAAFEQLRLERLLLVPAATPPHKPPLDLAAAEHRLRMAELAAAGHKGWVVSDLEVRRGGRSYSIDTVRAVIQEHGLRTRPFFLIGADMLQELAAWRDVAQLVQLCQFVVAGRPASTLEPPADLVKAIGLPKVRAICARVLHAPLLDVASSDVRSRVAKGLPFEHLVPPAVACYIAEHHIYRSPTRNVNGPPAHGAARSSPTSEGPKEGPP